jgi:3-isopropylmalate dehydrogenase
MTRSIAVLPGDGIGPEVTREAVRVLRAVRSDLRCEEAEVGGAAMLRGQTSLPDATQALCERSAGILFGAVGLPQFEQLPLDQRPEHALFSLRHTFDLFANLRPVRVFACLEQASNLKPEVVEGVDLVVVRELTSGIYFGRPKEIRQARDGDEAVDTMYYNAAQIERIARVGFALARSRRARVTSVDKQNILATSGLWRRIVTEVASDYPDVKLEHLLVDNASMQLIRRPKDFDVILTENMFGDILSDEAAMLTGSVGNLPSASLCSAALDQPVFGMYEPISGTAPDIAGRGIANPTAAILSAAMLLRHSLGDAETAERIERAVELAFAAGARTADLSTPGTPSLSTTAFTDVVIGSL